MLLITLKSNLTKRTSSTLFSVRSVQFQSGMKQSGVEVIRAPLEPRYIREKYRAIFGAS